MSSKKPSPWIGNAAVLCFLFGVVLVLQVSSGAWKSDFGAHADEASHVVTSLMVRDYLAGGFLEIAHPMGYAEEYYNRFPKVAIGHYPPLFYAVAGVLLLPFRTPEMMLLIMVLLVACAGWLIWRLGRNLGLHPIAAVGAGLTFCLLPLTRTYTAIVMSDVLLVVFCLMATMAFGRFLVSQRLTSSLWFGVWAAAAILTKGSGLMLALVPPVAILLTGKWSVLKSGKLWVAPLPVLLFAFPWMLFTRDITAEGMADTGLLTYFQSAVPYYLRALQVETGWVVTVGFGVTFFVMGFRRVRKTSCFGEISPFEASIWGWVLGAILLTLSIPAGMDHRYLLPLIPGVFLLTVSLLQKAIPKSEGRFVVGAACLLFLASLGETYRRVEKHFTGSVAAIEAGINSERENRQNLLVISDTHGEGALIAEATFSKPGTLRVYRGSKVLAESDWLGRGYQPRFDSGEEFFEILEQNQVNAVIVDRPENTGKRLTDHWRGALDILGAGESGPYELVKLIPSERKGGGDHTFLVFRIRDDP